MKRAPSVMFPILVLVCATSVFAQPPAGVTAAGTGEAPLTGVSVFVENDVLFQLGSNEDRNYTGGFGFRLAGGVVERAHLDAPLRGVIG